MTILIATLTPEFGLITQDSLIGDIPADDAADAESHIGQALSFDDAVSRTLTGDGEPPQVQTLGHCTKLAAYAHLHMIGGYAGSLAMAIKLKSALTHYVDAADVTGVSLIVPDLVRQLRQPGDRAEILQFIHIGFDPLRRKVVGYFHSGDRDFNGVQLAIGHTLQPIVDTADDGYDEIAAISEAAGYGTETEAFHLKVAQNQYRAWSAGKYRAGMTVGGQLHTALVDALGITLCISHSFPDGR